ncbi:uncharacterized protein LOC133330729 [Musca vetustissima]|uniref:uncharacterized protein LOC133330729 n=1 Tax=Musca vetustissima TaxID=27455 RepID=UPI002AB66FA1|nr:uncharacterized protein LOC133330729 [Musca vetustissima]
MNFSYMKIAIYVLTFITYAYSGYGSSTIAHLRDAIIAAEAIFGDGPHYPKLLYQMCYKSMYINFSHCT